MLKQNTPSEIAYRVVERLTQAGYESYWAGGCVRDRLLGRTPKDYDVATAATPDQIEALFDKTLPIGKAFGMIAVIEERVQIDVTTFRSDANYSDGRHPQQIQFTTAKEDVLRRDFTINGLLYNPLNDQLIDYVDGESDLKQGVIRAIGDAHSRFQEDHLRMLRAVRFAHTLGFRLTPSTRDAIRSHADKITKVSAERIEHELSRLLTESQTPGQALKSLEETDLLPHILPEVSALKGVEQSPKSHPEGDVFAHTLAMLDLLPTVAPHPNFTQRELAYSVLLHDIAKPETFTQSGDRESISFPDHEALGARKADEILRRIRFPARERKRVVQVIEMHYLPYISSTMNQADVRKLIGCSEFDLLLELHRLDGASSRGVPASYTFLCEKQETYKEGAILPERWINGAILLDAGYEKGARLGELLEVAYDRQLEEKETCPADLLNWLKAHYPS